MNTHELLKFIENDMTFLNLLKRGIVPLSVLSKKVYYERYLQEIESNESLQAIENTAEEYKVSTSTIRRAIIFMTE